MVERYDENVLLAFVEGELTPDQQRLIEQWTAADPRLARLLNAMVADRQILRSVPEPEAPAWLLEDIDADLERSMLLDDGPLHAQADQGRQRQAINRMGLGLAVAAMVLIAGGIVIYSIVALETQQRHMPSVARNDADSNQPSPTVARSDPVPAPIDAAPLTTASSIPVPTTQPDSELPPTGSPVVWQVTRVEQRGSEQRWVLRLKTNDLDQSVRQLSTVASSIDNAQLRPTVSGPEIKPQIDHVLALANGAPNSEAPKPLAMYELTLPADQLDRAVALLREELPGTDHHIALERSADSDEVGASALAQRGQLVIEPGLLGVVPDYAAILQQQVPLGDGAQTRRPAPLMEPVVNATVSVVIERLLKPIEPEKPGSSSPVHSPIDKRSNP